MNGFSSAQEYGMTEQETESEMVKCRECGTLIREADSTVGCPVCLLEKGGHENPENAFGGRQFAERYRIESFMSRGGMGQVFKAIDSQLGREVAIKLLVGKRYQDHEKVKRFRQEALTLSKVNHPNVCTIHDVGVSAEGPYIVMELVHGQTIGKLVKGGALPINQSLELMLQACRGGHAIHAKGIVHRDIKPSNVMVTAGNLLKIVDFGLATRSNRSRSDGTNCDAPENTLTDEVRTVAGHIVGTPNYMSPEQASGRFVDVRTDVFSLGAVFYVMLTGQPPFQAETPMLTMHAIIDRDYKPVRDLNPAVPEAVADLVDKMLADIDDRFESFKPVMETLEKQIATSSLENTVVEACSEGGVNGDVTSDPKTRSNVVRVRVIIALIGMLLFLGVWFWRWLLPDWPRGATSNGSGWMIKVEEPQFWIEVVAVVIDPVEFSDQKSHNRNASDVEREFYELLKQTAHEVLAENAVPIRVFDYQGWMKFESVHRYEDGTLDFTNAVINLLQENEANLFITIGGYFDQVSNAYHFDVGVLNSEGVVFQSSHMEFEDQMVQVADRAAVRESFVAWFDENFERSTSTE